MNWNIRFVLEFRDEVKGIYVRDMLFWRRPSELQSVLSINPFIQNNI